MIRLIGTTDVIVRILNKPVTIATKMDASQTIVDGKQKEQVLTEKVKQMKRSKYSYKTFKKFDGRDPMYSLLKKSLHHDRESK